MYYPKCSICKQPIKLETSKTDENGKSVHEDCYARRLIALVHDPPSPENTPREVSQKNGDAVGSLRPMISSHVRSFLASSSRHEMRP
jgi:hypothetical protein